ncbi:GAP family protein [Actinomadura sp. WMMB 499]|uniref:GAP family protein n=1 Tax=Actinomadura sp. WMMB 499 TaxID=1219491 RepID=UPI001245E20C|nr:GAP family protein [Actinomadura sp. WMMB 499]QFG23147.1 GAP family protein [Actinomadura sp. WMMB 499]
MSVEILPLAVTMMAGPQIISAIILVTGRRAVPVSAAFLLGVAIATTAGVAAARGVAALVGGGIEMGGHGHGDAGKAIQYALVALLVAAALKNYVRRETVEPPKWLAALLEADARKAFVTGLLIILLMPSDIVVLLTVGANLEQNGSGFAAALPFIGATVLIAALPLLFRLLLRRRAVHVMPRVRDWLDAHAWVVNVAACLIFIVLIL